MCGRYVLKTLLQSVMDLFSAVPEQSDLFTTPRFNIAPTQDLPVIRLDEQGHRRIALLRWGLIPSWANDPAIGNRMINARAETVAEKPAFKRAFEHRRCIIPADGFYEWKKLGKAKQPFYVHRSDDRPLGLAGLWERWRRDDKMIDSFTILTTSANDLMRPIHDRMPVIIPAAEYGTWLNPRAAPAELLPLLRPSDDATLIATPVSTRVNSPKNDDAGCIEGAESAPPSLFPPTDVEC